jgi:hypothetical protein
MPTLEERVAILEQTITKMSYKATCSDTNFTTEIKCTRCKKIACDICTICGTCEKALKCTNCNNEVCLVCCVNFHGYPEEINCPSCNEQGNLDYIDLSHKQPPLI